MKYIGQIATVMTEVQLAVATCSGVPVNSIRCGAM